MSAVAVVLGRDEDAARVLEGRGLGGLPRLSRFGEGPLQEPAFDFFRASYAMARTTLEDVQAPLAGVAGLDLDGVDLGTVLLVRLAYAAMSAEAPLLSMATRSEATEIVLVNGALSAAAVARQTGKPVRLLASAPAWRPSVKALSKLGRPWWRVRRHPAQGGLLAVVGGASEWPAVMAAIAALPPGLGVVLLGKTDRAPPPEALALLRGRPHVVAPLGHAIQGLASRPAIGLAQAALTECFLSGPSGIQEGDAAVMAGLGVHALGAAKWALGMTGLVDWYRPRVVMGAFEKTIHGPVLSDLRRTRGIRVVNLQHGVIARSGALAHMRFDAFLSWGPLFARACLADGYQPADSLRIVGNPAWEGAPGTVAPTATIGVLPQVPGKGYIGAAMMRRFHEALAGYARTRPQVRLLIKPHPADPTDPASHCAGIEALRAAGRLEILPPEGEAVRQVQGRISLAVTIYSTAALDCMAAGIPCVSFDPGRVLDHMEAQVEHLLPRATTDADLAAMLDAMLAAPQPPERADVFPTFAEPYSERIGAVIRGLLQG